MASVSFSSGDFNPDLLKNEENIGNIIRKKQTRTRSRAYRRRKALKRRKKSINHRKIIENYLKNKPERLEMLTEVFNKNLYKRNLHGDNKIETSTKFNELALFWKSKALSLELENKMLMKHIEELYRNIIESKNGTYNETDVIEDQEYYEYSEMDETQNDNEILDENIDQKNEMKKEVNSNSENVEFPKIIEDKKQRETQMKILYGDSYRKIMGMETVVQMQYDVLLDKEKINYWPVLPIKM